MKLILINLDFFLGTKKRIHILYDFCYIKLLVLIDFQFVLSS